MFVKSIKLIKKAMFPIFRFDEVNPGQYAINVVGTGFFINSSGLFATVAHVFDNPTPQTTNKFVGYLPDHLQNPQLVIREIARDNHHDIYVGQVDLHTPNFVEISTKIPDVGKSVCIAGYPLATLVPNNNGGMDASGVHRYFQPTFVLGNALSNTDSGRQHDGFLTRDFGLFGMSGGPIFDIHGKLQGIQGSVTAPRESRNGDRVITVENAVAIKTALLLALLKANNLRIGKPKVRRIAKRK